MNKVICIFLIFLLYGCSNSNEESPRFNRSDVDKEILRRLTDIERKVAEIEKKTNKLYSLKDLNPEEFALLETRKAIDLDRPIEEQASENQRQQKLTELANSEFSKLELDPDILLSESLQKLGATAEFIGDNRLEFLKLFQNKQWLELINLIQGTSHSKYPAYGNVKNAVAMLRKREFEIFIKTPVSEFEDKKRLIMVLLLDDEDGPVYMRAYYARKDLEGKGFIHTWKASDGRPIFAVAASYGMDFEVYFKEIMEGYKRKRLALKKKLLIGEINNDDYKKDLDQLIANAHADAKEWALAL